MAKFKPYLAGIAALLINTLSYAAQPGYYLGGQMGWGNVNQSGLSEGDMGGVMINAFGYSNFSMNNFSGTSSETGFAWRVFGGYQIGYNWAMEIGWSILPKLPVDAHVTGTDFVTGLDYEAHTTGTLKTGIFDAVGKYIYYLPCQFNIYGKLGLAYVTGWTNEDLFINELGFTVTGGGDQTLGRVYPTFGVGLGYDFRPDISMDVSYTRVQKIGNSEQLGSSDMLLAALVLHFG